MKSWEELPVPAHASCQSCFWGVIWDRNAHLAAQEHTQSTGHDVKVVMMFSRDRPGVLPTEPDAVHPDPSASQ